MIFRKIRCSALVSLCFSIVSFGQSAIQPVEWQASANPASAVKVGSKVLLDLAAEVQEGWHVYALTQPSGGPIPLRITLDQNDVAQIAGETSGTAPIKKHDASFGLETEFYQQSFTLHVPVEIKRPTGGRQVIPVSVRYQACSDRTCLPPRTVHLSVPVDILPAS